MDRVFYFQSAMLEIHHPPQADFDFILGHSPPGQCYKPPQPRGACPAYSHAAQVFTKIAIQILITY